MADIRLKTCPSCGAYTESNPCVTCGHDRASGEGSGADDFDFVLEEISSWSVAKHEIIEHYLRPYTTILSQQASIRRYVYIDAFAGTGYAIDKDQKEIVDGSAARAVAVSPPFHEIHLIEQNADRAKSLKFHFNDPRVRVLQGDAIRLLPPLLERCRYQDFARGLCLLDPYGLTVPWSLLYQIGQMKSVEIFFNFMMVSANRNVLWRDPSRVPEKKRALMDMAWGDRSWEEACYREQQNLFGTYQVKQSNEAVAEAFRRRLQDIAGFAHVPAPVPISMSNGPELYYLFFASPNKTGAKIVNAIFDKHRR